MCIAFFRRDVDDGTAINDLLELLNGLIIECKLQGIQLTGQHSWLYDLELSEVANNGLTVIDDVIILGDAVVDEK